MAFPSSGGVKPDNLAFAWERARGISGEVKAAATNLRTLALAGAPAGTVLTTAAMLAASKLELQTFSALPGIVAYARTQINDPAFDVAANFTAMMNAIDAVIANVMATFPKDGSNFLLYVTFKVNGETQNRVFTPAQLATLVSLLDTLIASIE